LTASTTQFALDASSGGETGDGSGARKARVTPFLDLSTIDLLDREGLGAFIPHRGHMMQLDAVVWWKPDYTLGVAVKHVRPDEFWCAGHIPGRPLLPGVLMVEAGAQLASYLYFVRMDHRRFAGFTRIEDTSFRGQVSPGDDLYLISREVKFHPKRFIADVQGMVKDRVVFESRVTGMIL
jgi:3-hydroxyacyl-[acyl-carrier-protein] dehydratase